MNLNYQVILIMLVIVLMLPHNNSYSQETSTLTRLSSEFVQQSNFLSDSRLNKLNNELVFDTSDGTWAYTSYDYIANNTIRPQIAFTDLGNNGSIDPIFTGMVRQGTLFRDQYFGYIGSSGIFQSFDAFPNIGSTSVGFGAICVFGSDLDAYAGIIAHNPTTSISFIDLEFLTVSSEWNSVLVGTFPSMTFVPNGDGEIWIVNTNEAIHKTTDFGNFFQVTTVGNGDPSVNVSQINGPSELTLNSSPNGTTISVAGTWENVNANSDDIVYLYTSSNSGLSWNGIIMGIDSVFGQVSNRNYAPLFQNFGQLTATIDNNGVTHLAINGFGVGQYGSDTLTNVYPALYRNTNMSQWVALTPVSYEGPTDGTGTSWQSPRIYSGNGLGNCYPGVSVSDDGQIIFYAWQAPEFTGAPGISSFNIYPGDGSANSGPIIYTDILATYSIDGGLTWSEIIHLEAEPWVMEQFPSLASRLYVNENVATIYYTYMNDVVPGASVFNGPLTNQNSISDSVELRVGKYSFSILPVPVDFAAFSAEQNNGNVILRWSTATETNNSGFEVERREVGKRQLTVGNQEWKTVGNVSGKGTTTEVNSYSFVDKSVVAGKFSYRLKQIDFDGTVNYSNAVEVDVTGPKEFSLSQNYPNPFNPSTKIHYTIPDVISTGGRNLFVTIKVYDILGNEVATLVNENKEPGRYTVDFNTDVYGLSSGVYIYTMKAGSFSQTHKMMLMK